MSPERAKQFHERLLRLERIVDFLCRSDRPEARCDYYSRASDYSNYGIMQEMDGLKLWLREIEIDAMNANPKGEA